VVDRAVVTVVPLSSNEVDVVPLSSSEVEVPPSSSSEVPVDSSSEVPVESTVTDDELPVVTLVDVSSLALAHATPTTSRAAPTAVRVAISLRNM
jgi:hypothetical protein